MTNSAGLLLDSGVNRARPKTVRDFLTSGPLGYFLPKKSRTGSARDRPLQPPKKPKLQAFLEQRKNPPWKLTLKGFLVEELQEPFIEKSGLGVIWWPRQENAQNELSGSLLGLFGGQGPVKARRYETFGP